MPSTSDKQHKFMLAAAHDKKFADKAKISQAVAKDFVDADKKEDKRSRTQKMIDKRYKE